MAGSFEEWGLAEYFFMTSEESLFGTDADRDDCRCESACRTFDQLGQQELIEGTYLPMGGLVCCF
jgi:hypothetical protein